jgi:protein-S-isoprenylcysteine O-methyltransferase Ste14
MFRYVTAANYFGELTEWTGWAIMTLSLPGLVFAIWTFANLGPRAYRHHKWYIEKFGDEYPKDRKRMIPFVY